MAYDLRGWTFEDTQEAAVFTKASEAEKVAHAVGCKLEGFMSGRLTPALAEQLSLTGFNLNDWIARHAGDGARDTERSLTLIEQAVRDIRRTL